jgi:hypothetical protein
MRSFLLLIALVLSIGVITAQKQHRIHVSPNGHYLQYEDGSPFFWLGDTGWELFHRLTLEEIDQYLTNRQEKGFTVIQAVILAEMDGLRRPNQYGQLPLINEDPERPNEDYFQFVDTVVRLAATHNLVMALLPTWGDKVLRMWGTGPVVFNERNAYSYGLYLGRRYRDNPNIIWVLGGDRPAYQDYTDYKPVWRAMANGIIEGTDSQAIFSYHPTAGAYSTSQFLNDETWLSIHMFQSGHGDGHDVPNWDFVHRDRTYTPTRPTLDGEPNYEDHPVNPWPDWDPADGYYDDYDVRKQCYRSVFAGAAGVTYGHHSIWQFYSPREEVINHAKMYWTEALDRPGAYQVGYLRKLMESRPLPDREPDIALILSGQGQGDGREHIEATRGGDGSYAFIYMPVGKNITVNTGLLSGNELTGWWFNPRDASVIKIGTWKKRSQQDFTPPSEEYFNDWVLVLDDASFGYPEPGSSCDCVPL